MPPEKRRTQIIEAATVCFGRFSYHEATMDQIAEEIGLSKGSLYRFFKSKEEVLIAAFKDMINALEQDIQTQTKESPPLTSLYLLCKLTISHISKRPETMALWVEFMRHKDSLTLLEKHYKNNQLLVETTVVKQKY